MYRSPRLFAVILAVALLATVIPLSAAVAASPPQSPTQYGGRVVQTFKNCGGTHFFGAVLDSAGNAKNGVKVRFWWDGGESYYDESGGYHNEWISGGGWDFSLGQDRHNQTFYVAVVDGSNNLLSEPVAVQTTATCEGEGAVNAVRVEFREGALAAPAPSAPQPAPGSGSEVTPAPSNSDVAPPITAGATCQFFTETGGGNGGYSVCDDSNARFLSTFRRYGLQNVGYPISQRFMRDGFITQAFQKAVFQWRPDSNDVAFVNVFDELSGRGFDQRLLEVRQTPYQLPPNWEGVNVPFEEARIMREALLDVRPALRRIYYGVSDPLLFFGLPTSEVTDMGNHYAIRLQRAVLQEWKENVPWARAGEVTVANGGDIAKELQHLPASALVMETAPPTGGTVGVPAVPIAQPVETPVPTPEPAPAPAPPVSSEPGRNLDARLPALGVGVLPASVSSGQAYWRAVEVIWHDESEAGGRHSIFVDVLDESGGKVVGQPVTIRWGGGSQQLFTEAKPFPEYSLNFPMYSAGNAYSVQVDGLPSDTVYGLGLGDLNLRDWTIHVEYLIKFQKVIKP